METTRIPPRQAQPARVYAPCWREVLQLAVAGLIPTCQQLEGLIDIWEDTP